MQLFQTNVTITNVEPFQITYSMPNRDGLFYIHPGKIGALSDLGIELGHTYDIEQKAVGQFKNGNFIYEWTKVYDHAKRHRIQEPQQSKLLKF